MPRIYRLPEHIANLIAAGEVVERPGSVAKELIENALDAGASRIAVEIKNGGVTYLRVSDDGSGIFPEDIRVAFMRHATSKIHSESDLEAIATMGFRGEALAAVASVARVDLFTRTRHSAEGAQITLEGGEEKSFTETGCPVGTTVVIRDLFYNVPARAKFLKKEATESAYVETAVVNAAISRPDVAFTFIKDGRESLFTPGDGSMLSAIHATCGREIAASLLQAAGTLGHVTVDGFVTPPAVNRANKNMQYFFVNGRPVRARLLVAAVDQAYKGRLMTGRHPACFLNLRLHASAVDVNVHPAKLEVKFSNEREVFSAVYNAIQTTLDGIDAGITTEKPAESWKPAAEDTVTPNQQAIRLARDSGGLTFGESYPGDSQRAASGLSIAYQTRQNASALRGITPVIAGMPPARPEYLVPAVTVDASDYDEPVDLPSKPSPVKAEQPPEPASPSLRIVGEAFKTYILAEDAAGLWLIDKHAAHERIIYNELEARREDMPSQMLLTPATVTLSRQEKAACLGHLEAFSEAGFEVEDFGSGALIVRQIPVYLDETDVEFVLSDMAQRLIDARPVDNAVLEALLNSIACRSAIKAGDITGPEEMAQFAQRVMADPEVRNCPHGRPVLVQITRRDVEKLFGRIQ